MFLVDFFDFLDSENYIVDIIAIIFQIIFNLVALPVCQSLIYLATFFISIDYDIVHIVVNILTITKLLFLFFMAILSIKNDRLFQFIVFPLLLVINMFSNPIDNFDHQSIEIRVQFMFAFQLDRTINHLTSELTYFSISFLVLRFDTAIRNQISNRIPSHFELEMLRTVEILVFTSSTDHFENLLFQLMVFRCHYFVDKEINKHN